MKKFLLSAALILGLSYNTQAQDWDSIINRPVDSTFSINILEDRSPIADTPARFHIDIPLKGRVSAMTYEELPEIVIISYEDNKEDPGGIQRIVLTRVQIWRFLQYIYHVQPMIDEAWKKEYKIDD